MNSPNDWQKKSITCRNKNAKKILLLHGFVGSPFDVKPLGDALKEDYTVHIPLLPMPKNGGENIWKEVLEIWSRFQPDLVPGSSSFQSHDNIGSKLASNNHTRCSQDTFWAHPKQRRKKAIPTRSMVDTNRKFFSPPNSCRKKYKTRPTCSSFMDTQPF